MSKHSKQFFKDRTVPYATKAAIVPQVAITNAIRRRTASSQLHFPSNATFADTGPITHNKNAEKEPRKAIIALNSGMKIENATAMSANTDLSTTIKIWLSMEDLFL